MLRVIAVNDDANPQELIRSTRGSTAIPAEIVEKARGILADVRTRGDAAVIEYTEKFDKVTLGREDFVITRRQMEEAANNLPQEQLGALVAAKDNIERFHNRQGYSPYQIKDVTGSIVGQRVVPLNRVGIYVPGGQAAYPSTLLMCAVPAKVAGVKEVICTSPIQPDSAVRDATLTAAYLAGVTSIYPIGGVQAIAAMTYGTASIPQVDKIVGPGNIWVTAAKMLVYSEVGLDMVAGPSEVLVIADETANPDHIAIDLISQAEHDERASVFLVTTSETLIAQVQEGIARHLETLEREPIARQSIDDNGIAFLVPHLKKGIEIANAVAAEHVEIVTENPREVFREIRNAGACFLGHYSPEAVGDYLVGPNHVLPTYGSARYFSGLSTYDFQRRMNFIDLTEEGFRSIAGHTIAFAELEGLGAHARSVKVRLEK